MGANAYEPTKMGKFIKNSDGSYGINPLAGAYTQYINSFQQNPPSGESILGGFSTQDPYAGTGALNWNAFQALYNAFGGVVPNSSGNNTGFTNFNIAKNPVSTGTLPSMKAANTSADLYNKYIPAPFTLEANTPKVVPMQRGLTYNNPYNTNPYLPLVNPFALIANNPGSTNV